MGKGDRKTRKGKIWLGSYGNRRNRKALKARSKGGVAPAVSTADEPASAKPKKTARKKTTES